MPSVNALPAELLTLIFQTYSDRYPLYDLSWFPLRRLTDLSHHMGLPLELSAVCRHWKEVAFSTPHLWHVLVINSTRKSFDRILEVLETRIRRSGNLLLSLHVSDTRFRFHWDRHTISSLLTFIERHSHRWARIELDVRGDSFARVGGFRLGDSDTRFPRLQRIGVRVDYALEDHPVISRSTSDQFPRLRSLSLSVLRPAVIKEAWAWPRLTILDLHSVNLSVIMAAVRLTPNLVHLRVADTLIDRMNDANEGPIKHPLILPSLQTVDLGRRGIADFPPVISSVQAPTLRRLRYITEFLDFPWVREYTDVLFPTPSQASPEIIIIVEEDPEHGDMNMDYVQAWAPHSHFLHLYSFNDRETMDFARACDELPPLWSDTTSADVCPVCLLYEVGRRHVFGY